MRRAIRSDWTAFAAQYGVHPSTAVPRRRSKYHAVRTTVDGITFDSKKEAARYAELKVREAAGEIADLTLQPVFLLHVMRLAYSGPLVIRTIGSYRADFEYLELATGEIWTEDVKGMRTPLYILKRKIVEAIYGLTITEI